MPVGGVCHPRKRTGSAHVVMGEFSKQHETTNRGPKEAKQTDPKPQMQQIENPKLNFNSNKLFQVNVFSF